MAYFDLVKLNLAQPIALKAFVSNCNSNRRDKVALKTTCMKNVNFDYYQNQDRLSEYSIHLLQRQPKLGRTKHSAGPHAGRELDIAGISKMSMLPSPGKISADAHDCVVLPDGLRSEIAFSRTCNIKTFQI